MVRNDYTRSISNQIGDDTMKKFTFINTEGFKFTFTANQLKARVFHLSFERKGEWAVFDERGNYRGQLYS